MLKRLKHCVKRTWQAGFNSYWMHPLSKIESHLNGGCPVGVVAMVGVVAFAAVFAFIVINVGLDSVCKFVAEVFVAISAPFIEVFAIQFASLFHGFFAEAKLLGKRLDDLF